MAKRIAMTGATGLIGQALTHALIARGDQVVAFSRNVAHAQAQLSRAHVVRWDPRDVHHTTSALEGCDTVVNLVGASIAGKRWTPAYKHILERSRVESTQQLLNAISHMHRRPQTFISSSGAGYYGIDRAHKTEQSQPGSDYLAQLCVQWEQAAQPAIDLGMRLVIARTGVVLAKHGGALPLMALPFRLFVGGPVLPGTQAISWIHLEDMVQLLMWMIDSPHATGAYNACAPHAVDNLTFGRTLAHTLRVPMWLPVPQFALRLLFGEMADALLIGGQAVISERLEREGFTYRYPTVDTALADIYGR